MNRGRNNMNENSIKKESGEKKYKHSRRRGGAPRDGGTAGVPRGYRPETAELRGYRPPTAGASLDVLCLGWVVVAIAVAVVRVNKKIRQNRRIV